MQCSVWHLRQALAGVEESRFFSETRERIVEDLRSGTNDKSLAGRIDVRIEELVHFINASFPQYVTSSSCSGRVSLFHKGMTSTSKAQLTSSLVKTQGPDGSQPLAMSFNAAERRKRGSFGRGTLFQSHDPLPGVVALFAKEQIAPVLQKFWAWRQAQPHDVLLTKSEVLQLKFEPMILHILCADMDAAAELLKCGSESGQMNSGIASCSRGTPRHRKITCAITSPLCMDIPLFAHGKWCLKPEDFTGEIWSTFLEAALLHANALFDENERRRERFRQELQNRLALHTRSTAPKGRQ